MPIDKLTGVHPRLATAIRQIRAAMEVLGRPMLITDGVRTAEEQRILWLKGRNAAGQVIDPQKVVTNADGTVKRSNHQLHPDGFGHAVDCTFLDPLGHPRWIERDPWALYGAMGKTLGLKWGGDWGGLVDRPHLELPDDV